MTARNIGSKMPMKLENWAWHFSVFFLWNSALNTVLVNQWRTHSLFSVSSCEQINPQLLILRYVTYFVSVLPNLDTANPSSIWRTLIKIFVPPGNICFLMRECREGRKISAVIFSDRFPVCAISSFNCLCIHNLLISSLITTFLMFMWINFKPSWQFRLNRKTLRKSALWFYNKRNWTPVLFSVSLKPFPQWRRNRFSALKIIHFQSLER